VREKHCYPPLAFCLLPDIHVPWLSPNTLSFSERPQL
jgi:hypothetical protein